MQLSLPLALSFCAAAASAIPTAMSTSPVILFTPGAWHGPWAFDAIRKDLGSRGLTTAAATLPSVGSTDATVGLAEDTASVRAEIEKLVNKGREVVVVAHSYGGVPSSNAVEGLNLKDRVAAGEKGGVKAVVYMTSFAIPAGTSLVDGVGGVYPSWWNITVCGQDVEM
jgi:triacylglycerol esterase/lipase EstA (alpha/beta hydrolase family)